MAFIPFNRVPNDAPVTVRGAVPQTPAASTPRRREFAPRLARALPWIVATGLLAFIGIRIAVSFESPTLGIAGAALSFLIGVALTSATRGNASC